MSLLSFDLMQQVFIVHQNLLDMQGLKAGKKASQGSFNHTNIVTLFQASFRQRNNIREILGGRTATPQLPETE